MSKFINESWLVLVMGVAFAALLAGTQTSLSARIRANENRALNEAIAQVVPTVDKTEPLEIDGNLVFKCLDADGQLTGWAIQAEGGGFIDKITLVVGLSADTTKITGMKVVKNTETPGLGNKIDNAVDPEWSKQYNGLDATRELKVEKRPPVKGQNEIQAITGATYSSVYVTDIVNDVNTRIRPKLADL